jgi:hypothetical protein
LELLPIDKSKRRRRRTVGRVWEAVLFQRLCLLKLEKEKVSVGCLLNTDS